MRPEPNNDIDLLLRQLSRRNGIPVSEIDEQHLDADELNSYVANALPEAARARYTEHLADCSSCRKLVAQLSAAQGPVAVQPTASVVVPGWKSFFASLFSPMVLRYAVPALGLIVIAAVGLFVIRPEPSDTDVAQVRENEIKTTTAPAPSQQQAASPPTANSSDSITSPRREAPQSDPVVAPETKDARGKVAAEPKGQSADDAGTSAAAPLAPKVAAIQNEAAPAASAESQPAKKEKAAEQEKDAKVTAASEPIKRDYNRDQEFAVSVAPGATTRQDVEVRTAQRSATPMGAGTGSLKRPPAKAKDAATGEDKAEEPAAETRAVAGRRFRKSGGIWIDTDYDGSKPITTVARGSEQFRALVADEPAIKTIVDQLDGQIVVVWKGRTYRIR